MDCAPRLPRKQPEPHAASDAPTQFYAAFCQSRLEALRPTRLFARATWRSPHHGCADSATAASYRSSNLNEAHERSLAWPMRHAQSSRQYPERPQDEAIDPTIRMK